uniref:Uncharacterized protein n=1 Tax=Vespula pensylvanica TaxID=30213 RepID=A0A834P1I9_VESPE|nr:hypothetical protein H0235_007604 [Vespula pensylvanica]
MAASGKKRSNGDSTLKSANRDAFPLRELRASQQTGDPHAFPHLGTDLRIAQLSNTGSFDHHLSTTDCASRQTPESKIESYRTHRYLREYAGNTHASMLSTLEPSLDLIAPENTNAYASRHCSTVHTVSFGYLETRPVVSIFRLQKSKRSPR